MYAKREFFHFIKVALYRLVYPRESDTILSAERKVYRLNVLASATLSKDGSARNDLKSGVTRVTYRHGMRCDLHLPVCAVGMAAWLPHVEQCVTGNPT